MSQALAIVEQQPATPARPIPKRIRQAVELLLTGECTTQKAAAARVNVHPDYLCRALKRSDVQVFVARASRQTIAAGTMRATARLLELLDADSEHVSLDATKHALALNGIKPATDPQVSVNIELKAGYVIDLSDKPAAARDADRAQVIDAVEVVDND